MAGEDISTLGDNRLSEIRASRVGFIFQSYNLIPQLSVLENIEVPLHYQRRFDSRARRCSLELAEMVGLTDRLKHRPTQLSGGQQQRVAIARSLVNDPYFILADEPTGNLDSTSSLEILAIFKRLHRDGRTVILVTHDHEVAEHADRVIVLKDGTIAEDRSVPRPRDAEQECKTLPEKEDAE